MPAPPPLIAPSPLVTEYLKKKELVLAAMTMSNEEFDQLVAQRNQLIVKSAVASGDAHI
jgi:hypothetical protein